MLVKPDWRNQPVLSLAQALSSDIHKHRVQQPDPWRGDEEQLGGEDAEAGACQLEIRRVWLWRPPGRVAGGKEVRQGSGSQDEAGGRGSAPERLGGRGPGGGVVRHTRGGGGGGGGAALSCGRRCT